MNRKLTVFEQNGFSLIEILVTMVILMVGLLGLIGLQGRALNAQKESYQRSQALVLVQDMMSRIEGNKTASAGYKTTGVGSGFNSNNIMACAGTRAAIDLCEWHNLLLGASELNSSGVPVGGLIGARGCVYEISAAEPKQYVVAVAWQGLSSTKQPDLNCGTGQYGDDTLRRVVATPITIGKTH